MNASDGIVDPKKFLKTQFSELTDYHKAKILQKAKEYRLAHAKLVLDIIKTAHCTEEAPPRGSYIFDPAKWEAENWLWFGTLLMQKKI